MSRNSQSLYDRHITIFSPEGRLYQVEYAFRAVRSCNLTAVALKGDTSACIVVQKKVPLQHVQHDKLLDMSSASSLHGITTEIGSVMLGMPGDCRSIVFRARDIVGEFEYKRGHKMPAHYLALKVANLNQLYSQHAYMRLSVCCGIFISIDEATREPSIYKFDPAGWFAGYKACAVGTKEQEGARALEKVLRQGELDSEVKTIQAAISALKSILDRDFKSNDIEVGVVSLDDPSFRRLNEVEIEEHLTVVAEREHD